MSVASEVSTSRAAETVIRRPEGAHRRSTPTTTESAAHLDAVDGLRALAVLAVVYFHFSSSGLPGGFLGVDLFFVISGFVITRMLLLKRSADGRVSLAEFWTRRARRLLPAVLAVVLAVQVWSHTQGSTALTSVIRGQSWSSLVYGSNWWNISTHIGYFDGSLNSSPLNHLWSLAIEEQFYLVWPVCFVVTARRSILAVLTTALMVVSGSLQFVGADHGWSVNRLYLGTDTRGFALLGGALLALILIRPGNPSGSISAPRTVMRLLALLGPVGLAALAFCWRRVQLDIPHLFHGQLLAVTFIEVGLIACVVLAPHTAFARLVGSRPMTFVGRRSYSLYLWHWPVIAIADEAHTHVRGTSLLVLRGLLIATLTLVSYALVENPIRRSNLRGARLLVPALAAIVGLSYYSLSFHPALTAVQAANQASAPTQRAGQAGGGTVLVVGDSWARNLGVGMVNVDKTSTIINDGLGGCGIADPTAYETGDRGTFATPVQCLQWQQTWRQAITAAHPDAAVLTVGNWDQAPGRIAGQWRQPCDPTFDSAYAAKLDTALTILSQPGIQVFMTNVRDGTTPAGVNLAICMNQMLASAAQRHPTVHFLDFDNFLCPKHICATTRDGAAVYDDTGHLAPAWQNRAATWVLSTIYQSVTVTPSAKPKTSPMQLVLPRPDEVATIVPDAQTGAAVTAADVLSRAPLGLVAGCGSTATATGAAAWSGPTGATFSALACEYSADTSPNAIAAAAMSSLKQRGFGPADQGPTKPTELYVKRQGAHLDAAIIVRLAEKIAVVVTTGAPGTTVPQLQALAGTLTNRFAAIS